MEKAGQEADASNKSETKAAPEPQLVSPDSSEIKAEFRGAPNYALEVEEQVRHA